MILRKCLNGRERPLRIATGFTYLGPKFMKEKGLEFVTFSSADGALEAAPASIFTPNRPAEVEYLNKQPAADCRPKPNETLFWAQRGCSLVLIFEQTIEGGKPSNQEVKI
ncbi:uncharacterized protein A4U43_C08F21610 [Asparagus officinalis]|nr:uncharacterized protein A4U43_C08F21610 [Asparagus officinalis]